ncbi:MAG: hypothetical protein AB8F95_11380 [Bacteroidia bacterium]
MISRTIILILFLSSFAFGKTQKTPKYIHVFVALCDNANQGIVPVPASLGNGQKPASNLYWGAMYGLKSYFKRDSHWRSLGKQASPGFPVLERWLFQHANTGAILVADAYDGAEMADCMQAFLEKAAGCGPAFTWENDTLWQADLVSFVGHNGLMDTDLSKPAIDKDTTIVPAILLCCIARDYFGPFLKKAGAYPLVWTTGLMAPEAYTLSSALDRWLEGGDDLAVRQAAAEAYHKYQKCGLRAAKNLLVTGF